MRQTEASRDQSPVKPDAAAHAERLLAWFDRHRRELPWRARPGEAADPYRVWLSEIMLQQTTVAAVAVCFYLKNRMIRAIGQHRTQSAN